jgi:FAD:protein FMN transferase
MMMSAMQIFRIPFKAMASECELVIAISDIQDAQPIAQAAIDEVLRVERKYSRYRPDSIVSRINAAAGLHAVDCDAETWALLEYADTLYQSSGGLFDVTAGVLRRAWDFKTPQLPSEDALARLCQLIGWRDVERQHQQIRLPTVGMELDVGGFGKEYAADRAGAILAAKGIHHGYVNLGGDMYVLGPKPDGQAWMIGIQDPRDKKKLMATIPIERGGLATSGDYERYFELDGRRYCHVLNPHSGMPVTYWRTVSVLAPLAVMAGNCSTIAMLKQEAGLAYLDAAGVSYLAMDQQGKIHTKTPPAA